MTAVTTPREMPGGVKATIGAYVALTKPRIIELLLVTTLPAMMLAAHGLPRPGVAAGTMIGGTAAAGSANAFNCYLDRDIDAMMGRTLNRPLIRSTVSARGALTFAVALATASAGLLWALTNPLACGLTLSAIAIYVVGYTLLLKRRTPSNIVWGGAAGCMPTLIGWAAVRDGLAWTPVLLFGVVFFWTPPHFWALAMRFRRDYAAAGVPMLPAVADDGVVVRRMTTYTVLTVATSLALWPVAGTGPVYGVSAVLLGAWFGREIWLLRAAVAHHDPVRPLRVFHASISYLSLLFLAVALDVVVRHWM